VKPGDRVRCDHLRQRGSVIAAFCGLIGSGCFTAGWLTAGELTPHYSVIHQTISELARTGAPQHLLMTGAFIVFGLATIAFGTVLSKSLGYPRFLWSSAVLIGASALGIAAFPLSRHGGTTEDLLHEGFAIVAYVGGAFMPVIAGLALRRRNRQLAGNISVAVGSCVIGLSAALFFSYAGLFQRLGVTIVLCWIAAISVQLLRAVFARSPLSSAFA
jgi:hypothetical membrane protein